MRKPLFAAMALALTAGSMTGTAFAAPANTVKFGDLDLDSKAGQDTLEGRIRNAARQICDQEETTGTRLKSGCHDSVRKQVLAQVEEYQNSVGKGG